MQQVDSNTFGYLIAYLLPGTMAWFSLGKRIRIELADNFGGGSIGGFVSTTLVVLFLGMVFSTVRWLLIDSVHHHTGIRPKSWNFQKLNENLTSFEAIGKFQYHYYQFYANSIVAGTSALICLKVRSAIEWLSWFDLPFLAIIVLFWLASRDTLGKYYERANQMLA